MNMQQIKQVVQDGKDVFWYNGSYRVILQNDCLYTVFKYNASMCKLQECEYNDCFIKYTFTAFLPNNETHRTTIHAVNINDAYSKWLADFGHIEFIGNLSIFCNKQTN